jgi:hypothetical protein
VIPALSSFSPNLGQGRDHRDSQRQRLHRGHLRDVQRRRGTVQRDLLFPDHRHSPAGATTGPIAVTTVGGTGVSQASFSVRGHH